MSQVESKIEMPPVIKKLPIVIGVGLQAFMDCILKGFHIVGSFFHLLWCECLDVVKVVVRFFVFLKARMDPFDAISEI